MAREPLKQQQRFGPAQARASVFSTFAPARVDNDASRAAQNLADIAGTAAEYQGNRELETAREERDQGLRDFVSGLVQDGQRIQDGELQPIESEYYMAGVEMGRGRRRGREVWAAFQEWQAENPRPGLGSPQDYQEWLNEGLAIAQESSGIDPDVMSEAEYGEYAAVVNQVRQRDNEQFLSQLNREVRQEQLETMNSDIMALASEYDVDNPQLTYETAQNLLTRARMQGMDLNAVRQTLLTQMGNIARASGDVSILENIPEGHLKTPAIESSRLSLIASVEREIESEQYENEAAILGEVQDFLQQGRVDEAQLLLDSAFDEERIRQETRNNWDQRIHNERRTWENRNRRETIETNNNARRAAAIQGAMAGGTIAAGVTYLDAEGESVRISGQEAAEIYEAGFYETRDRSVDSIAELSHITERTRLMFPSVAAHFDNILSISQERLETGSLGPAQEAAVRSLINMNENSLSLYLEGDDLDQVQTMRFLQQTGGHTPAESLALARRISTVASPPAHLLQSRSGGIRDKLASANRTWLQWLTVDDLPLSDRFDAIDNLNIDRFNQYERNAATINWSTQIAQTAARIEEAVSREAARDYVDRVIDSTMVVNRQPVSAIGPLSGQEGTLFLNDVLPRVGLGYLAPELHAAHGDEWWNVILGREGEWNPHDRDMRNALIGEVDVRSVPGGVRFEIDEASVFLSTQDMLELESVWREGMTDERRAEIESILSESTLTDFDRAILRIFAHTASGLAPYYTPTTSGDD